MANPYPTADGRMRRALTEEIGGRLDEIIRRLHLIEERCQRIEKRLQDLDRFEKLDARLGELEKRTAVIPVAEYLPRG